MNTTNHLVALSVLLGACCTSSGSGIEPPLKTRPRSATEPDGVNVATARRLHLGDGINRANYGFIAEHLKKNPGSKQAASSTERSQREALRSSGDAMLKPPSANIVESELSHLLGAVMRSNGAVGAAVFDTFGLKVAAAGLQLESIILPSDRLASVLAIGVDDEVLVVSYCCAELVASCAGVSYPCPRASERAGRCKPPATRGVPCMSREEMGKTCKRALVALYRPVLDFDADPPRAVGASMLVVTQ